MISASAQYKAILATRQFYIADLYTFTLLNGAIYRFTSYDMSLTFGSEVFRSDNIIIKTSGIKRTLGITVDNAQITINPRTNTAIGGVPILQLIANGGLDGAEILIERTVMNNPPDTSAGKIIRFKGQIGDIDGATPSEIIIPIVSDIQLLNIKMPRNCFQTGCLNNVFDTGCGLNESDYTVTASVKSGATLSVIATTATNISGYFNGGKIVFLNGANAGLVKTIRSNAVGNIYPITPLKIIPSVNDQVEIFPGCDRIKTTCDIKFNNLPNFRGFPFIPVAETAI